MILFVGMLNLQDFLLVHTIRQLRYWVQGHNPQRLQQQGMSALLYVRDDFLPKSTTNVGGDAEVLESRS